MSRAGRFLASLGSAYIALIANILSTGFSIPLALKYLPREQYGVWILVLQITGYLMLLDMGVGQAVSRVLIDHKDDQDKGDYGAILKASWVVFGVEGLLIVALAVAFGPFLASAFNVPLNLRETFVALLVSVCFVAGIVLSLQPIFLPLWGHQRSDVVNWSSVGQLLTSILALWLSLAVGMGLWSLVLASIAGDFVFLIGCIFSSIHLGLLPKRGCWGKLRRRHFQEIFSFSREMFILILGNQVLSASQIILATRLINLDAAAAWSVCTKTFMLGQQVVWRIQDFSTPGLAEMYVRGESERFQRRIGEIAAITFALSGLITVLGAFYSREVISIWTHGAFKWAMVNDIGFAAFLLFNSVARCFRETSVAMKRVSRLKFSTAAEAALFVVISILIVPRLGLLGLILASLVSDLICLGSYALYVICNQLNRPPIPYLTAYLGRPAAAVAGYAVVAFFIWAVLSRFGEQVQFFAGAPLTALVGALLLARFALPSSITSEIRERLLFQLTSKFRKAVS